MDDETIKLISEMQAKIFDKLDTLEDSVKDNVHGLTLELQTTNSQLMLMNARVTVIDTTVNNHQRVLFNGNNDGMVTQFAVLKNDVKKQIAMWATGGSLVAGLIMKLLGDFILNGN